ncbi:flagellar hook protein FlgK [Pandoraea sp. SD6-2]|uniref:FlgK family flagellar hook-associated protein n=1 Tax=Pandoraea sp. SD6-2 TaxID=1286093 RepID=UPI00032F5045|nr:flagellar hook protein FlgK [Pandoraea sp. SD6-2]EON15107.1 flagellar hook-associated protein FlgK [Pandoraea sp. SD6-2]
MNMLNIATQGVKTAQLLLDNESLNISQMGNSAYTRRNVRVTSRADGTVQAQEVARVAGLEQRRQLWRAVAGASELEVQKPHADALLTQLGGTDVASDPLGLRDFVKALDHEAQTVGGDVHADEVFAALGRVAERTNLMFSALERMRENVNMVRTGDAEKVNRLTATLADLNRLHRLAPDEAGRLAIEDQRDQALGELATFIDVDVREDGSGAYHILTRSGHPLVLGNRAAQLEALPAGGYALVAGASRVNVPAEGLGGRLGGHDRFLTRELDQRIADVTEVARTLVEQLNRAHADDQSSSFSGTPLLSMTTSPNGAPRLERTLATAQGLDLNADSLHGNGKTLQRLKGAINAPVSLPGRVSGTLVEAMSALAADTGRRASEIEASGTSAGAVLVSARTQFQKQAGVDETESGGALMSYMKLYRANARVASVANELFDATLAMVR